MDGSILLTCYKYNFDQPPKDKDTEKEEKRRGN